jgi:hypothetical protein
MYNIRDVMDLCSTKLAELQGPQVNIDIPSQLVLDAHKRAQPGLQDYWQFMERQGKREVMRRLYLSDAKLGQLGCQRAAALGLKANAPVFTSQAFGATEVGRCCAWQGMVRDVGASTTFTAMLDAAV